MGMGLGLDKWLKETSINAITENLESLNKGMAKVLISSGVDLQQTPETFNPGVFDVLKTLTENIFVPVGILIFSFILFYELISLILEKNRMQEELDYKYILKWLIKSVVGILIITNSWTIVNGVLGFAQKIVVGASAETMNYIVQNSDGGINFAQYLDSINELGYGTLIWYSFLTFVARVFEYIYKLVIPALIYLRMFEIYLIISTSPIPLAGIINTEFRSSSFNYLKRIFAKGLQAVLMLIILAMSVGLQTNVFMSTSGDIGSAIWGLLLGNGVLLVLLSKTGGIANAILGL